ncbi:amidohydrolase family protein [Echinicola sp. CAU 1574]|uniref:Amidohydrolase family protein n=1 Tax=Echinicola arenosa TaxID=2774144 RepID=A0ABR9AJS2_9BACT|nr:amidohydrolase family protein [Echinicola arenosa]MBD8489058.1 amidohydrolase family protein [Echinicola arenosa]
MNDKLLSLALTIILAFCLACSKPENTSTEQFDIFIKGAQVLDGTGAPPFYANILVRNGLIQKIEQDTSKKFQADELINAKGKILTPGFIDTHAHGSPIETPDFRNFLAMGVTTIFLGQDGSSPSTADISEWMDKVDASQLGPNIGMFVGHGTLRMLSGVKYQTTPKEDDLAKMDSLLQMAMDAGCFGLSTGLEYNPGYLADSLELLRLAKIVGESGGMIMSHMRNEDDDAMERSIDELLLQGSYCPVHISHIKVVYAKGEERANEILEKLEISRTKGKTITADIYPYEASYTGISILFPDWAKAPANYEEVVKNRRTELENYLRDRVNKRNGPEATLIGSGPYSGKNLAEIAVMLKKPFEKVLVDDIGPSGTSAAYFVMDETVMKTFLKAPLINVCSDGSPNSSHPRGYGTFAKIIENYVMKDSLLSLSEAIHKMTGLPAKTLGITDRGLIKEGYMADLLVFQPSEVKAKATYEKADQLAEGFDLVIVNGEITKSGNEFSEGNGQIIKKK